MVEPSPLVIAAEVYLAVGKLNRALQLCADAGIQVDINVLDLTKLSNKATCLYIDARCLTLLPSNQ